jgi:hypothetical protein
VEFRNFEIRYFGISDTRSSKGHELKKQDSRSSESQNPEKTFEKNRHRDILGFGILRNREPTKCLHRNSLNHEKPVVLELLGTWSPVMVT